MSDNTRLYVGNLTYVAQKIDVRALFADHGNEVKHIDISIDTFTGRNGTYCFVDFPLSTAPARRCTPRRAKTSEDDQSASGPMSTERARAAS